MKITPEGIAAIQPILDQCPRDPLILNQIVKRVRNRMLGAFYHRLGRDFYDVIDGDPVRIHWDTAVEQSLMWSAKYGAVAHGMRIVRGSTQFAMVQVAGILVEHRDHLQDLPLSLQDRVFEVRDQTYLSTMCLMFLSPKSIEGFAPSLISQDWENRDWIQCPPDKWGEVIITMLKQEKASLEVSDESV